MLDRSRRIPASGAPWTHVCSFQGGRGGISPIASTQFLEEPRIRAAAAAPFSYPLGLIALTAPRPSPSGAGPSRASGSAAAARAGGTAPSAPRTAEPAADARL